MPTELRIAPSDDLPIYCAVDAVWFYLKAICDAVNAFGKDVIEIKSAHPSLDTLGDIVSDALA